MEKKVNKKNAKPLKIKKRVSDGIVNIHSTYNNTIITVTDIKGNTIAWQSAGTIGYKGTKKSTPYAAKIATEKCMEIVKPVGLKTLIIYTKGIGPGKSSAVKTIREMEFEIKLIKDITPSPFNGCRLKKRLRK